MYLGFLEVGIGDVVRSRKSLVCGYGRSGEGGSGSSGSRKPRGRGGGGQQKNRKREDDDFGFGRPTPKFSRRRPQAKKPVKKEP
mmetsp:Transcript_785/g.1938  ORF Transcript_785/g.1938 Transcript_785/m.1938 type:complete len:84 (-) Transcript_785:2548-2799(-)